MQLFEGFCEEEVKRFIIKINKTSNLFIQKLSIIEVKVDKLKYKLKFD